MIKLIPIPSSENSDIVQWHMYLCTINNALSYPILPSLDARIEMLHQLESKLKELKQSGLCKPEKDEMLGMTQVAINNIESLI